MNDAAKERSMADIIKLDSANDRSSHGVKAKNSQAINGPAQILFFTGVRYERRPTEPETPAPTTTNGRPVQPGKAVKS